MAKKTQTSKQESPVITPRASISFPPNVYQTLEEIAREKKVSLAWVVREATEEYIANRWPLLHMPKKE